MSVKYIITLFVNEINVCVCVCVRAKWNQRYGIN